MRLSEFRAGTILVDGYGKVFIHDGFINADGYGVIIGEDSDGMIQKSNGIGNWMKGYLREATSQEVTMEKLIVSRKSTNHPENDINR